MLKKFSLFFVSTLLFCLIIMPVNAQGSVTVMGVWTGAEAEAFQKMVAPFEEETGIKVEFTGTRDLPAILTTRVQAGNPPDVSAMPNPGQMLQFAKEGRFMDRETLLTQYSDAWLDLGSYDGELYSIFISADLKSMVWYSPKAFAAAGYEVPSTWEELNALSDKMVADGNTPWARIASPETYDAWVNHEIAWTNETVMRAFEIFGDITQNSEYVYGGPNAVLTIPFGDSADALFTDPPNAYMHRQATFIKGFILEHFPDLVPGECCRYACYV